MAGASLTVEGSLTAATETTVGNATSIGIGVNRIEIGVFAAWGDVRSQLFFPHRVRARFSLGNTVRNASPHGETARATYYQQKISMFCDNLVK